MLFTYTSHPQVAKYVEAIIGPSFKSVHTMVSGDARDKRDAMRGLDWLSLTCDWCVGVFSSLSQLINKPPDVGVGSSRHPPHQGTLDRQNTRKLSAAQQ